MDSDENVWLHTTQVEILLTLNQFTILVPIKKKSQFSILFLDFHRIGCIWLKKCISVFVLCIALNTFLQTKLTLISFFDFISDWFVCEVCFAVTNAKTKKRIWAFVAAICGLCFCHHHKFGTGNLFLRFGS